MSTLNDEILRATGGPTVNDGLRAWYLANGAVGPVTATLNDLEWQFLRVQMPVGTSTTLNDMWMDYLSNLGYTGTINDMKFQYWSAQP